MKWFENMRSEDKVFVIILAFIFTPIVLGVLGTTAVHVIHAINGTQPTDLPR